jgi:hypothetical protein
LARRDRPGRASRDCFSLRHNGSFHRVYETAPANGRAVASTNAAPGFLTNTCRYCMARSSARDWRRPCS